MYPLCHPHTCPQDIKSSNVLLTASGQAKLGDVALSRLQVGTFLRDVCFWQIVCTHDQHVQFRPRLHQVPVTCTPACLPPLPRPHSLCPQVGTFLSDLPLIGTFAW